MLTSSRKDAPPSSLQTRGLVVLMVWSLLVAASVALILTLTILGRTDPLRASLAWVGTWALFFCAALAWVSAFAFVLLQRFHDGRHRILRAAIIVHGPLALGSLGASAAIYSSDWFNHQVASFLQPTASLAVILAVVATIVAQRTALRSAERPGIGLSGALAPSCQWAVPLSLALLGLLQGASYLWVIGNDFTRYWNVADALRSWAGYPAIANMPVYVQIGEPRYIVELPGFSTLLLLSFAVAGHDTLGAHIPNLLANAALPAMMYAYFRQAGIGRGLAFAGSALLATQPFFRLYTLNAPVPDAVFLSLLVGAAIAFQSVTGYQLSAISYQPSEPRTQNPERGSVFSPQSSVHSRPWLAFGFMAGAIVLTRPEGIFFLGFMGLALLPSIRTKGPYLAAAVFLATVLPFVAIMLTTFGIPWPNNAGAAFGIKHVETNIYWLQEKTLRWYANAFQLSTLQFLALLGMMVGAMGAGTLLLWRKLRALAALPLAAAANVALVFAVDPTVSGVHLWFDFFRHISYGLPFLLLPLLLLLQRLAQTVEGHLPVRSPIRAVAWRGAVVLLLAISLFQINLLARPSQTHGDGSVQLLTSDIWVSFQDIVAHRYPLPMTPLARNQDGILVITPQFDRAYMLKHLDSVKQFFEPYSNINVDKGFQYEVSSALVLLFGAFFALLSNRERRFEDHGKSRAEPPSP